jgi:hypothetical protein
MVGERVQVAPQFRQSQSGSHGHAVVDDVQIRVSKIDNAIAAGVLDVGISNIPFAWYSPVKHLASAHNLVDPKRNSLSDSTKGFTKPIPRDASADWVEF